MSAGFAIPLENVPRRKGSKVIRCGQCSTEVMGYGSQKFCIQCSNARHSARQSKWKKQNPASPEQTRRTTQRQNEARVKRGEKVSRAAARTIAWSASESPDLASLVRVAFPFSYGLSKNRLWSMASGGSHVFMRQEIRNTKQALALIVQSAVKAGQIQFMPGKVWLDILIQKPNHKGDAVNLVDFICDAVKVGIGVDDRWFSIRRLDWEIVKTDPKIFIGIGQEEMTEQRVCSRCGQSRPLAHFPSHKRTCVVCSRADGAQIIEGGAP